MKMLLTTWIWNPMALILLGGIISLIGTFWATRQQVASEREYRVRAEETLAYLQGDHSLEIAHRFDASNGKEILTLFVRNISNLPTYGLTARVIDVYPESRPMFRNVSGTWMLPSHIPFEYDKHWPSWIYAELQEMLSLRLTKNLSVNSYSFSDKNVL